MLDHLVKLGQLGLLILIKLLHDQLLGVDAVVHLLLELLDRSLHPVLVVLRWSDVLLLELLLDVAPDLAHLEVRVHLDHLQLLLLVGIEVVSREPHSVEDGEYYQSDVVLLHLLSNSVHQVSLSARLSQILKVCRLGQILLDQLWDKRLQSIKDNSLFVPNTVLLILFAVELDHELGGIDHGLLTVPFKEFLDGLGVFSQIGEA